MLTLCGAGRHSHALGGWTIYADNRVDESPLAPTEGAVSAKMDAARKNMTEEGQAHKKAKVIDARFGYAPKKVITSLDRVEFKIEEEYKDNQTEISCRPSIRLLFEGSDIFEGLRLLTHRGLIEEKRMPAWITGELGVSSGLIRNGKLVPL